MTISRIRWGNVTLVLGACLAAVLLMSGPERPALSPGAVAAVPAERVTVAPVDAVGGEFVESAEPRRPRRERSRSRRRDRHPQRSTAAVREVERMRRLPIGAVWKPPRPPAAAREFGLER